MNGNPSQPVIPAMGSMAPTAGARPPAVMAARAQATAGHAGLGLLALLLTALLALLAGGLGAQALGVLQAQPLPAPREWTVRWACVVPYTPSGAVWERSLTLRADTTAVREVQVDGQKVHSFAVADTLLLTALDNERIRFDTDSGAWHSDFRGLAVGEGWCQRL